MQANTKCHLNIFRNTFSVGLDKKARNKICVRLKAPVNRSFRFVQFLPTRLCIVYKNNQKQERFLCFQKREWPMGILVLWACRSDKPSPILGLNKTPQEETAWDNFFCHIYLFVQNIKHSFLCFFCSTPKNSWQKKQKKV